MAGRGRPATRTAAVLTALLLGILTTPHASATTRADSGGATRTAAAAGNGEPVARLRQEVRSGSSLGQHGVHPVCPRCAAQVVTEKTGSSAPLRSSVPAGYGPADLSTAYALPVRSTSTATIALIAAGVDPHLASDPAAYRAEFGLPSCETASGCLTLGADSAMEP